MSNEQQIVLQMAVPEELNQKRLDQALAAMFPEYSRAQLQQWIKQGNVKINNETCTKPRQKVSAEQTVDITATLSPQASWQAQAIPLDIIFEDDELIVINKPVGLVVHPGAGNPDNTLVNALLHHSSQLELVPRAGIIHRLDKDTTGLLLIAKTLTAHNALSQAMKAREIKREYIALVKGDLISGGTVDMPIGRHPTNRIKMAVTPSGREAITHYRIAERFPTHTLLDIQLETGRTHQIRVHMNHIHHPLVGDPVYGRHIALPASLSETAKAALQQFKRQALHAKQLSFSHPVTEKTVTLLAPIPDDFELLLKALRDE